MEYVRQYPMATTAACVFVGAALLLLLFDAPFVKDTRQTAAGVPVRTVNMQSVALWAAAATALWWAWPWLQTQLADYWRAPVE